MSADDQSADLEAIRARYAASTPGTWRWTSDAYSEYLGTDAGAPVAIANAVREDSTIVASDADVAFIAHAHQDIPWLLDEVVRLRTENAALSALVYQLRVVLRDIQTGTRRGS